MRVETNETLIKRSKRIAQYLFITSLFILIGGFVVINFPFLMPDASEELAALAFVAPTLILPLAFITTIFSVRMTNMWIRQPRPEAVIPENLKGVGKNAVLYSYYHLPARHVLIAPQGVFAIVTRFQDGKFTVDGDRWQSQRSAVGRIFGLMRFDGIRNPSTDALLAAQHVQNLLKNIAPEVKVQPVVVFTDPRVRLTIIEPGVPVVHAQTRIQPCLKDLVKDVPKDQRVSLTPEQIAAFEAATLPAGHKAAVEA